MRRTFKVLLYTAQRPVDALSLPRAIQSGTLIKLRQVKTKQLVMLPCHSALRSDLDAWENGSTLLCGWPGQAITRYKRFAEKFREYRKEAKLEPLQIDRKSTHLNSSH